MRKDWKKNIKERMREVKALKQRQEKEKEKEKKKNIRRQEKEKSEKEILQKLEMEKKEYEYQIESLVPILEEMENTWNNLKTVSSANTAEDIIVYWKGNLYLMICFLIDILKIGLNEKNIKMNELIKYTEICEMESKDLLDELIKEASKVYEKYVEKYGNEDERIFNINNEYALQHIHNHKNCNNK